MSKGTSLLTVLTLTLTLAPLSWLRGASAASWLHRPEGSRAPAGNGSSSGRPAPVGVPRPARIAGTHPRGAAAARSTAMTPVHRRTGAGTPVWLRATGGSLIGTDTHAAYWTASLTADPSVTWTITGT